MTTWRTGIIHHISHLYVPIHLTLKYSQIIVCINIRERTSPSTKEGNWQFRKLITSTITTRGLYLPMSVEAIARSNWLILQLLVRKWQLSLGQANFFIFIRYANPMSNVPNRAVQAQFSTIMYDIMLISTWKFNPF